MAVQVINFKVPYWPIEEETAYKPQTTFWQDFSIADKFGTGAVQDTYNRAFAEWKGNYNMPSASPWRWDCCWRF